MGFRLNGQRDSAAKFTTISGCSSSNNLYTASRSVMLSFTKDEVLKTYELVKKNQYGQYLKDVLDGKYREQLY